MTPKLPSVRELARELSNINSYEYGEYVGLCITRERWLILSPAEPASLCLEPGYSYIGREYIPGDAAPFDAHAAARRLISDARSSMKGTK